LSLLLALLACGFTAGPHIGYRPPPVSHLPASQLRLAIQISGQYEPYGSPSNSLDAHIGVRVFEGQSSSEVSLSDKGRLTCNGQDISLRSLSPVPSLQFSCPRQPPGGAYHLAYTDERGASTTVVVPVLLGSFAILSPQTGSTVPIPTHGILQVRYTVPVVPAHDGVAVNDVTVVCSRSETQPCGGVFANLRPAVTAMPGQGRGVATVAPSAYRRSAVRPVIAGMSNATPMPGKTPTRGSIPTQGPTPLPGTTPSPTVPAATPTVVVTQNGQTGTILLTGDYSEFQPAKGILSLSVEAHVESDPGDFAAVTASYSDILHSYFTWTR
jgi:hypothetical protein